MPELGPFWTCTIIRDSESGTGKSPLHTEFLAGMAVVAGQAFLADARVCDGMLHHVQQALVISVH